MSSPERLSVDNRPPKPLPRKKFSLNHDESTVAGKNGKEINKAHHGNTFSIFNPFDECDGMGDSTKGYKQPTNDGDKRMRAHSESQANADIASAPPGIDIRDFGVPKKDEQIKKVLKYEPPNLKHEGDVNVDMADLPRMATIPGPLESREYKQKKNMELGMAHIAGINNFPLAMEVQVIDDAVEINTAKETLDASTRERSAIEMRNNKRNSIHVAGSCAIESAVKRRRSG